MNTFRLLLCYRYVFFDNHKHFSHTEFSMLKRNFFFMTSVDFHASQNIQMTFGYVASPITIIMDYEMLQGVSYMPYDMRCGA